MSALTSGPYGDGRREGRFPNGTFIEHENHGGPGMGIVIGDAGVAQLSGQPLPAKPGNWGDLSWRFWLTDGPAVAYG